MPPRIKEVQLGDQKMGPFLTKVTSPQGEEILIQFTAPELRFPGSVLFEYKLEGYNEDWIAAGSRREVRYSALPHGKFTFMVRTTGNPNPTSLKIIVPPYYWQRVIFWLPFAVIFGILIALFVRYRILIVSRKRIAEADFKRNFVRSRLSALQAQLNPHFIFNCLNSIQYLFLVGDERRANTYLSEFSTLLRMILEYSHQSEISLEEEMRFLTLYTELENLQFDHPFSFEIDIDPVIRQDSIMIPAMILQPFIENSIHHGLRHLDRAGKILLRFSLSGTFLMIEIEDNGIGRAKAAKLQKVRNRKHKSRGMEIIEERINLLQGLKGKKCEVEIIDLKSGSEEPKGTQICIQLPINNKF